MAKDKSGFTVTERGNLWDSELGLRPPMAELTVIEDVSRAVINGLVLTDTVEYYGAIIEYDKKAKRHVYVQKADESEKKFKKRWANETEFNKQREALIVKTVKFDFTGVTVDLLLKFEITTTTIRKKWYNDVWVKKTPDEIEAAPKTVIVKVAELLKSHGGGDRTGTRKYDDRRKNYMDGLMEFMVTGPKPAQLKEKEAELAALFNIKDEHRMGYTPKDEKK